jgi:hypothetical protein
MTTRRFVGETRTDRSCSRAAPWRAEQCRARQFRAIVAIVGRSVPVGTVRAVLAIRAPHKTMSSPPEADADTNRPGSQRRCGWSVSATAGSRALNVGQIDSVAGGKAEGMMVRDSADLFATDATARESGGRSDRSVISDESRTAGSSEQVTVDVSRAVDRLRTLVRSGSPEPPPGRWTRRRGGAAGIRRTHP